MIKQTKEITVTVTVKYDGPNCSSSCQGLDDEYNFCRVFACGVSFDKDEGEYVRCDQCKAETDD